MRPRLHQGVVGAGKDGLCFADGIDLPSTSLLADLVVLDQPVAFGMQRRDVLQGGRQLLRRGGLALGLRLQLGLDAWGAIDRYLKMGEAGWKCRRVWGVAKCAAAWHHR